MPSTSSVGRTPARRARCPSTVLSASTGSPTTRYSSVRLHVESTTASEISGSPTSSRMKRSAPVSVIDRRVLPPLRELRQLHQLALDARQLRRHDRHVHEDQRQEDEVGSGDV